MRIVWFSSLIFRKYSQINSRYSNIVSRILLSRALIVPIRTTLFATTTHPSLPSRLLLWLLHRAISRSPQEGASGCTIVDSGGAFRGCFQCWCSAARYCIVYNNIYSDVYSRCCARCSLTQHVSVNASTYTHIQVAHARARVLRECYVLSRSRIVRKSGCLCSWESVHRGDKTTDGGGQHHATHARACTFARGAARLRGGCVYACVVGARSSKCETHGAGARLRDFCKVPVHTYGETVYI